MRIGSMLCLLAMAAAMSANANDVRTGLGGAVGAAGGAAVGERIGGSTGAIVGAGVGGAAGAVIGGSITADAGRPKSPAAQPVGAAALPGAPATAYSCNRNNPGKGYAKGHCKH